MLITAPRVVTAEAGRQILEPGYVAVAGGTSDRGGAGAAAAAADIALPTGMLLPGFVDLQVNGYFGEEFQAADADGWAKVVTRLPQTGTTAVAAHLHHRAARRARRGAAGRGGADPGAARRARRRVLGVHAEGPFISPARKGAHNEAWITDPTPAAVDELLEAGRGVLRLVTLAPERDGALAAISPADRGRGPGQRRPQRRDRAAGGRRPPTAARGWSPTCSTRSARCTTASPAWSARR